MRGWTGSARGWGAKGDEYTGWNETRANCCRGGEITGVTAKSEAANSDTLVLKIGEQRLAATDSYSKLTTHILLAVVHRTTWCGQVRRRMNKAAAAVLG